MSLGIGLAERGVLPDGIVRHGIRGLLAERLRSLPRDDDHQGEFLAQLASAPVAVAQDAANRQHYEVPARFYQLALGPRLKYSCGYWLDTEHDLAVAEAGMLTLTCDRAGIRDGMTILDVGCGWGSLSLWMAERFPTARIQALSNSHSQRAFIEARAAERGLDNLRVTTGDLAEWTTSERFDRIVSVECLEHMRNHGELFRRFRRWLTPKGRVFIHVFTHRTTTYLFDTDGDDDWMARHFFTGGMMPAWDLFRRYDDALQVEREWLVSGHHYARTARAWLANTDAHRDEIRALFARDLGEGEAKRMLNRWRIFCMACEELWGWDGGREWPIGHYLLAPTNGTADQWRPMP